MSDIKLLTNFYKQQQANSLVNSVSGNGFYFFVGDHIPHTVSPPTLENIYDDTTDTFLNAYSKMIMGKQIKSSDVMPVIRNIPWTNKVFAMYDQDDQTLS